MPRIHDILKFLEIRCAFKNFSFPADSILNIKSLSSDLSKVFAPKGIAVKEGDFIKRPDYGKTLKLVAENGVDAVYAGSVADNIINSVRFSYFPGLVN